MMRLATTIVFGVISIVAYGYYCDNTKNILKGPHSDRIYCLGISNSLGHPRELYNLRYCKYFSEKATLASVHAFSIGHIIAQAPLMRMINLCSAKIHKFASFEAFLSRFEAYRSQSQLENILKERHRTYDQRRKKRKTRNVQQNQVAAAFELDQVIRHKHEATGSFSLQDDVMRGRIGCQLISLYRETSKARRYPMSRMVFWFGLKTINGTLLFDDGTETATFSDLLSRLDIENFGRMADDGEKCWSMSLNTNGHNITFHNMKCEPSAEFVRAKRIYMSALCQYEKPEESGNHVLKKRELEGNKEINGNENATGKLPSYTFSTVLDRDYDVVDSILQSTYNSTATQAAVAETSPLTFGSSTYFADVTSSSKSNETESSDGMTTGLSQTESLSDSGFLMGATTPYSRDTTIVGRRFSETKQVFANTHSKGTPTARLLPDITDIPTGSTGTPSSEGNQRSTIASQSLSNTPSRSDVIASEPSNTGASATTTARETTTVAVKQTILLSTGTTALSTNRLSTFTDLTNVTRTTPAFTTRNITTTVVATEFAKTIRSTERTVAYGITSLRTSTVGAAQSSGVSAAHFPSTAPISRKHFSQKAEIEITQSSTTSQNYVINMTYTASHNNGTSYTSERIERMTSTSAVTAYWKKSNDTKVFRKAPEQSLADKMLLYTISSLCGAGMIASAICFLLSFFGLILADTHSKPMND